MCNIEYIVLIHMLMNDYNASNIRNMVLRWYDP